MTNAIRFHEYGGPEVLQLEDVTVGDPGPGEARIRQKACGLNYIDTYHRSGLYKVPLPSGAGNEGAGVVEAVGSGVTTSSPATAWRTREDRSGAYAEARNIPADRLCVLPEGISFEQAAAMMLQGHDRAVPAPADLHGPARRHGALPRGRGRRGPHRLPVGEGPGRHGDRHRGLGGEGELAREAWRRDHASSTARRTSSSG